jgi:hypothetical protein
MHQAKKLDRVLVDLEWLDTFPEAFVENYVSCILTIILSFYDTVVYQCLKESDLSILKLLSPLIRIIRRWFLELGVFMRRMFYKG